MAYKLLAYRPSLKRWKEYSSYSNINLAFQEMNEEFELHKKACLDSGHACDYTDWKIEDSDEV